MAWGAAGSIFSSLIGADASRSASNKQVDAANKATDTNLKMFQTVNDQQAPWRQAGQNALGTISDLQPQFMHQFASLKLISKSRQAHHAFVSYVVSVLHDDTTSLRKPIKLGAP